MTSSALLRNAGHGVPLAERRLGAGACFLPRAVKDGQRAGPEIAQVLQLLTMATGPDRLLVAARIDLRGGLDSEQIKDISTYIDRSIRDRIPTLAEVFLDATDRERFTRARRPPLAVVIDDPGQGPSADDG